MKTTSSNSNLLLHKMADIFQDSHFTDFGVYICIQLSASIYLNANLNENNLEKFESDTNIYMYIL